ncbi:MAG: glycosyltransferase involved in cell wall biosynthesis [Planctomycetota bacterium]|jgi:glycosyltransferase involved in cell wall biosynthesis
MKIQHVITTLDVGGAEMHLLSQVRGQCERGHQVRIAYLKGDGRLTQDYLEAGADQILPIGTGPMTPFRLARAVGWSDITHSHLLKADAITACVATMIGARKRLISGKHNDERALLNPWVSRIHGFLGNLPVKTIVLSDHVGRFVEEHGRVKPAKLERVYYGIDPQPFERAAATPASDKEALRCEFGFDAADVVFTCVARFAAQKAHDVLLRAFRHAIDTAPAECPRLRLLLVGDDPFGDGREKAEAVARELALGDAVVFAGIRRDVPLILASSDVFVMSSLWEGLGLVFLEAMAVSIPVLSTRVSAIPEVVVDGETGLLVAPGEDLPLAKAALQLALQPALRKELGSAGRQRVLEHFGLDRMVDETLAIYRRVSGIGSPASIGSA